MLSGGFLAKIIMEDLLRIIWISKCTYLSDFQYCLWLIEGSVFLFQIQVILFCGSQYRRHIVIVILPEKLLIEYRKWMGLKRSLKSSFCHSDVRKFWVKLNFYYSIDKKRRINKSNCFSHESELVTIYGIGSRSQPSRNARDSPEKEWFVPRPV